MWSVCLLQPLRLDIKRKLTARSDRVKSVDLHPTEPWMLASLYNGNVHVWNHESQQLVKSFEVIHKYTQSKLSAFEFFLESSAILTYIDLIGNIVGVRCSCTCFTLCSS